VEQADFQAIRQALRDASRASSIRKLARTIGMSPTGLRNIMEGKRAHPGTEAKLREWYVKNAPRVDSDARHAALDLLARGLAPELRDGFRKAVAVLLGSVHGEAGLPLPAWAGEDAKDAHADGLRRRADRFATVEVHGADPVVLVRPPFPGDPRAVAEALGTERGVWSGSDYYPPHRINRVRLGEEEQL
jgi:hypothetical protein